MWRRKGGLWVLKEDGAPRKSAERPHAVALFLGLASTIVALLAVYISSQSFRVSEQSLKASQSSTRIAQRAYLDIANATIQIRELSNAKAGTLFYTLDDAELTTYGLAEILYVLEVRNLGNTPAHFKDVHIVLDTGLDWVMLKDGYQSVVENQTNRFGDPLALPNDLGPKSSRVVESSVGIAFTSKAAAQSYRQMREMAAKGLTDFVQALHHERYLRLTGSIRFTDVFEEEHTVPVCWSVAFRDASDNGCPIIPPAIAFQ